MDLPTFFIVGAPKCGTTSLAAWLDEHEGIFMCRPKEPHFFATDLAAPHAVTTLKAYKELFRDAPLGTIKGEASTTYLRSRIAVPAILDACPNAKFIVCLRNPVEMAMSVHAQLVRMGRERERDFEMAWKSQEHHRKDGTDPVDGQYFRMCSLGAQVSALLTQVDRKKDVKFVLLDDIKNEPRALYEAVLSFLRVDDDGRRSFPIHNERMVPKSLLAARLGHLAAKLKRALGVRRGTGLSTIIASVNERYPETNEREISSSMRSILHDSFREDIILLESLIHRDLSSWVASRP